LATQIVYGGCDHDTADFLRNHPAENGSKVVRM
jgi:hypothetical protein